LSNTIVDPEASSYDSIEFSCFETKQDSPAVSPCNKQSIMYNNRALNLIGFPVPARHSDKKKLKQAISLLDSAIASDSTCYHAYANKANFLLMLHERNAAIAVMERITRIRPEYAEGMEFLGGIFESVGNMELARRQYRCAGDVYHQRYNSTKSPNSFQGMILTKLLLEENRSLDSLMVIAESQFAGNDSVLKDIRKLVKSFKRSDFMSVFNK
jgi:tetratricopeptide (TPR) repeat protein